MSDYENIVTKHFIENKKYLDDWERTLINVAKGTLIQFKDKDTRDDFYFNLTHLINKDYRDIKKMEVYEKEKVT